MKRILCTFLFLAAFMAGYTQLQNNGGTITVSAGASVVIEGSYTSTGAGSIEIDGTVTLKGDFINNGGTVNPGSTGLLKFNGTTDQEITGSASTTFACAVEVDNAAGVALTGINEVIGSSLTLINGDVTLNGFDLTLSSAGVTGASGLKHIVTNSTGELKATVGAGDYEFPVGDGSSYNPVKLNNTGGTSDTYGVVYTGAMPGGWTGIDHAVTGNWAVTEGTPGGSNLTVTPQWNGSQEQPLFNRTNCAVGVSGDNGASVTWAASGAAAGTDPYFKDGAFTDVGTFVVGDDFYLAITLNLNVILAGAYNGTDMSTSLRAQNLVPTTDPYGLGTTVASVPLDVVDWVLVEFRNKLDNTDVLYSRAFFIDANGQLINPSDGGVGGKLAGMPKDEYYVSVQHRNHLGAMTLNTVDFASGSASFNFSDPLSGVYGTNAMFDWFGTGVMTLWAGDADGDNTVQYLTGLSDTFPVTIAVFLDPLNVDFLEFWAVTPVYDPADTDMNGTVEYLTGSSDTFPITTSVFFDPGNVDFLEFWEVIEQLP